MASFFFRALKFGSLLLHRYWHPPLTSFVRFFRHPDEGSSARRTFFRACGRGSWILKRKKEFFRGNLRKKGEKVLPRVPAEEGSEGSSAGSSGSWFRRFFRGLQRKNYVFRGSHGRTCGTFFRRQHFLLAEEPVESSSTGKLSFSRKNIRNVFRGACCALGAGRGRGISKDMHEADVPLRRRPTASARRQQVRLREDVTERPEDVPQLHEDVPHVSDATPEIASVADAVQTEGVATDGSLGSPAANEGFPGGPRDPSILTDFAEHVAHSIWSGRERPDLKLVSHGRKVDKIGRPAPEIEGLIVGTGLSPLIRCSVITTDPGLISVFVERWHRETSTFHLPVGELTITLDDVVSLLHLPITGALHTFEPLVTSDAIRLLTELLEVSDEEATFETRQAGGPHVRLGWLRDLYQSQCRTRRWVVAARTYLLHLVGCTLFANKSSTHVHVVHLEAFRDLAQAVHTSVVHDAYDEGSPRACRWLTGKAHITGIKGAPYRRRLDALSVTDVCWMPYGEHRRVRAFDLISSYTGQLRWGELCVVPGQVATDYMEWFFRISHPFVMRTEETVALRHPPPPHHEEFVEPPIPEISVATDLPTHSVVHYERCQGMAQDLGAIAEDLERVINLRMVTEGTDLHDIMTRCLRRARGDTTNGSLRPRQRRRID
ncbi:Protein MAIN-LIKE 1 [Glycine max]|nr:Protein MAIN-LIKE 1 [Glycine max]